MKKGFTMIELVFVIVILGILAIVAIPRLVSSREDAEISTAVANIRTLLSDVNAYFTTKGNFNGVKWKDLTNVPLRKENGAAIDATVGAVGGIMDGTSTKTFLAVGGKNCLQVGIIETNDITYIAFSPVAANKNDPACATFLTSELTKQILNSTLASKPDNTDHDPNRGFCTGVSAGGMSCLVISPNSVY